MKNIILPVFNFFNISIGDPSIIEKATAYLEELIITENFDKKIGYLWINKTINVETVNFAIIYEHNKLKSFELLNKGSNNIYDDSESIYSRWISAQGNYILSILKISKEEDFSIQQWLNYIDFIKELAYTKNGCSILCDIYDLRGIDFFLIHFMDSKTSAIYDEVMFENAKNISKALKVFSRFEESIKVSKDINERKNRIIEISNKYKRDKIDENIFENLRVRGERFWNEYLDNSIWSKLHVNSKADLIESFISEFLLENKILTNWSSVILSLAKVIERELSLSLYEPWIKLIQNSTFTIPSDSKNNSKVDLFRARKVTYDIIYRCAQEQIRSPTFGQLVFIGKYWSDLIMDQCTNLFSLCRNELLNIHPDSLTKIDKIISLIEENKSNDNNSANILDLRNASAHPGKETEYHWDEYLDWMKKCIGKPPKLILKLILENTRM